MSKITQLPASHKPEIRYVKDCNAGDIVRKDQYICVVMHSTNGMIDCYHHKHHYIAAQIVGGSWYDSTTMVEVIPPGTRFELVV